MLKKRFLLGLIIIVLFYLGENFYLPRKNMEFEFIANEIYKAKEETLKKKEELLKTSYNFNDYLDYKIEYSKVLFKDLYHYKNEITIYKGKKQNIKENNLVINQDGLVGVVKKVNENSSVVELLNNDNLSLSVKIDNAYGILKYKDKKLVIEGINNKVNIKKGSPVTTSDISIHPENVYIGIIKNINYDKYEIEQILEVESKVDFNNVTYLGIITDLRGAE